MKSNKNNGILISLVVLAAAALLYFSGLRGNRGATIIVGKEPLANLPVSKISAIVIADEASTLTLRRAEEQWVVVNRKGYPADPDRIENFVKSFTEMKALRELSAGAEQLDRIGLKQGTRVTLQDDKGNAIHTLTLTIYEIPFGQRAKQCQHRRWRNRTLLGWSTAQGIQPCTIRRWKSLAA